MPKERLLIALAIIRHPRDDLYLIAQRPADTHLPNTWEFPGGKCLPDEEPSDCAVREACEETGLTVTVMEAWPAYTFEYPERIVMLHPFLCHADQADARPIGSLHVVWVAPADLERYSFPSANTPLLERLCENW